MRARRFIAQAAIHSPTLLYRLGGAWSGLTASLDPRPVSLDGLQVVFPDVGPAAALRAAREIRAAAVKTRLLSAALATTGDPAAFPAVTIEPEGAGLGEQAVITGFHFGPVGALADVLRTSPRRVTALHRMGWAQPPNVDYVAVAHDEPGRVAAFYQLLEAVRRGASAFVLADHPEGLRVPLLGGTITMQRGAFALARLTGLPVVPLLPRWEGPRIHVYVAQAVAAVPDEHAMAAATASALERYLLEHPHAIGRKLLAELADEIGADQMASPGRANVISGTRQ